MEIVQRLVFWLKVHCDLAASFASSMSLSSTFRISRDRPSNFVHPTGYGPASPSVNTHHEKGISNYQNTKTQLHIDANHTWITVLGSMNRYNHEMKNDWIYILHMYHSQFNPQSKPLKKNKPSDPTKPAPFFVPSRGS